jgi:hypothetical protein
MTDQVDISGGAARSAGGTAEEGRPHQFGLTAAMALIAGSIIGVGALNGWTMICAEMPLAAALGGDALLRRSDRMRCKDATLPWPLRPVRTGTGASIPLLVLAIGTAGVVLLTFVFTTLIHEAASVVTLLAIVVLSVGLDFGWKRVHAGRAKHAEVQHQVIKELR